MTNEQKNQVAAMNASGMSVDEISAQAEIGAEEVTEFLASREHLKDTVRRLCEEGKSTVEIAEITGISTTTVGHIKGGLKRRKEPAAAEAVTSSKENIVQVQDTTKTAESQALKAAKAKLLAIYETLSPEECRAWEMGEVYAEVVRGCGE